MSSEVREQFRLVGTKVPEFSLKGRTLWARVVSVYDGDTLTCIVPLFGNHYKFSVRMNGIDTCEIKSKLEENKKKAIQARNQLLQWIMIDKQFPLSEPYTKKQIEEMLASDVYLVYMRCDSFDKYGRLLADVFPAEEVSTDPQQCFSERMIAGGLAYRYFGDTKLTEAEQSAQL